MTIVTGDRYLESLVKFVEKQAGPLLEGALALKLNPVGLHYVQSRLEALQELEGLLADAPVDYLRAYISDLGDHRALEQLRRILRLLTSLKVVSVFTPPARDPTPLSLLPFENLKVLELRGCDLSTSAAKGLLELRHTLEKIICHNSTDALRHVFASRIVDIKDSPVWNRLSVVSCACNGLVLMDESLQLLPAVETLDLSRNRFAKVDNLKKLTKLKHLDLGFNHLRSIASFTEVLCPIVKLVLRNNALTTLRGIENLKSIEGLDLSYNIISNFSELEIFASLPSLHSLWLEGNPICCSGWYRAQVFSYFTHPEELKLDEKEISTRESWERQIILASRHRRPAGFGFYAPAKDDAKGDDNFNPKRKKLSSLACIDDEQKKHLASSDAEQESTSCEGEIRSREENVISDGEAEIVCLMNRVEFMKKERPVLWLREFKEWMDQTSDDTVDNSIFTDWIGLGEENYSKYKKDDHNHPGESSKNFSDLIQVSVNERSSLIIDDIFVNEMNFKQEHLRGSSKENPNRLSVSIDEIMGSYSSSTYPGSPPHYQEDILHRRHNLEEEIMQLSASYSLTSSDNDTSCSGDDLCESDISVSEVDLLRRENFLNGIMNKNPKLLPFVSYPDRRHEDPHLRENEVAHNVTEESRCLEQRKGKRKAKIRVVSLLEEKEVHVTELLNQRQNGTRDGSMANWDSAPRIQTSGDTDFLESDEVNDKNRIWINTNVTPNDVGSNSVLTTKSTSPKLEAEEFVKNYFDANIADPSVSETCLQYMLCDYLHQESEHRESEVAVLLSSAKRLYVLRIDAASDGSGSITEVMGSHMLEDIREVLVGLGLQVLSVHIEMGATYLFITRNIEKSRGLLCLLQVCDSNATDISRCSLRSLEQVQVKLFEKHICGGLKVSIFLYSMLLFWSNNSNSEEKSWLSRSLFVIGGYMLVCIEDLIQLSSLPLDDGSSSYYSLDSCCSISSISEMVIEHKDVTLTVDCVTSEKPNSSVVFENKKPITKLEDKAFRGSSYKWKLKWFSEDTLLKFVTLLKSLHAGMTVSPLRVRCIS
ncbi:hypothetical protein GIB67_001813 [Kingdonia uniflora]|uniref:Outer arm dynein light chain 1 protein n=1 Tax=Kingdonia uniflora TaxID=39325 RepID=A0A7J7LBY7_9MAGN|nr:hypothetical protein GIB67_001813 [Kingdonia uniflora]